MGLKSYDGEKNQIVFECPKCKREGSDCMRTIPEEEIELISEDQLLALHLPLCPTCKARSYVMPGEELRGPITHLRALLLKRRYEANGGDGNEKLARAKAHLEKLATSYDEVGNEVVRREFSSGKFGNLRRVRPAEILSDDGLERFMPWKKEKPEEKPPKDE